MAVANEQTGFYYRAAIRSVSKDFTDMGRLIASASPNTRVQLPNLPSLRIPAEVNDYVFVQISHVKTCNHFYVQFRESEQNILSIAERLALIYDNAIAAKEMEFLNPARGDICAANWSEDGCWYRACVVEKTDFRKFKVYFVDYGNVEDVPRDKVLRLVDKQLLNYPPQAIAVTIDIRGKTPKYTVAALNQMLANLPVAIALVSVNQSPHEHSDDSFVVKMIYDNNGQEDIDIAAVVCGERALPSLKPAPYVPQSSKFISNSPRLQTYQTNQPIGNIDNSSSTVHESISSNIVPAFPGQRREQFQSAPAAFKRPPPGVAGGDYANDRGFGSTKTDTGFGNRNGGDYGNRTEQGSFGVNRNGGGGFVSNRNEAGFGNRTEQGGGYGNRSSGGGFGNKSSGGGGGFESTNTGFGSSNRNNDTASQPSRFGGGGGGGALTCHNCKQTGHFARDCPQPRETRAPVVCRSCNEPGHFSRDCPNRAGAGATGGFRSDNIGGGFRSDNIGGGFRSDNTTGSFGAKPNQSNWNNDRRGDQQNGFSRVREFGQPAASIGNNDDLDAAFSGGGDTNRNQHKSVKNIYKFDKKSAKIGNSPVDCIRLPEEESSPSHFYILLKSDEEIRNKIDSLIKKGIVPLDRFEVGVACLSIYDGLWYRAEIITTDTVKRSASIVYVDYGNKEEKQFDELFAVDSSQDEIIRSTFWLAIECELDGITGSIDETTIEKFIELTSAADDDEGDGEKLLTVTFLGVDDAGRYTAQLYDKNTSEPIVKALLVVDAEANCETSVTEHEFGDNIVKDDLDQALTNVQSDEQVQVRRSVDDDDIVSADVEQA